MNCKFPKPVMASRLRRNETRSLSFLCSYRPSDQSAQNSDYIIASFTFFMSKTTRMTDALITYRQLSLLHLKFCQHTLLSLYIDILVLIILLYLKFCQHTLLSLYIDILVLIILLHLKLSTHPVEFIC